MFAVWCFLGQLTEGLHVGSLFKKFRSLRAPKPCGPIVTIRDLPLLLLIFRCQRLVLTVNKRNALNS